MNDNLPFGLTRDDLKLDPATLERAADLDAMELLAYITDPDYVKNFPDVSYATLDAALALYQTLIIDTAYEGLNRLDLWAAALDTAIIWCWG